jgi:hypothetical protein
MYRAIMLWAPIGIAGFSEGNSHPSGPVSGEAESHAFKSCRRPLASATALTDFSVFGVSMSRRETRSTMSAESS